ncbi:hypothetical protein N1028_15635 [Herbiconiux sp. CPCC 203407]|uniref:site-specific DNA-methyltransferase (adenine-specific) n=1 Tax=Herbiconiux oxytropis TaxID=2970915 RepID=A0AA42BUW0_9MICO|nr:hypothetical protein [Herbiconiux oxytropis]MCS5721801.1 hypothetical protein [Herbiconiux oxytropis]MCS5727327.1 hypothetical protein [Herbiconiux oxytropis]
MKRRAGGRVDPPYFDSVRARRDARLAALTASEELRGFVDPFVDGGAAALAVLQRFPDASVTLASTDEELVATWEAVRDEPEAVIRSMRGLVGGHGPAQFAAVRADAASAGAERAARFIYLRGAAAPDARGRPPVDVASATMGRGDVVFDEANLRAVSALVARSDVAFERLSPFALLPRVQEDDLVYLDTDSAGAVSAGPRELRSLVGAITARGGQVLATAELTGLTVVADGLWGSGNLRRALAREGADGRS